MKRFLTMVIAMVAVVVACRTNYAGFFQSYAIAQETVGTPDETTLGYCTCKANKSNNGCAEPGCQCGHLKLCTWGKATKGAKTNTCFCKDQTKSEPADTPEELIQGTQDPIIDSP